MGPLLTWWVGNRGGQVVTKVVTGVTSQKRGSWGEREALKESSMQSGAGEGARGVGGVALGSPYNRPRTPPGVQTR